MHTRLAQIESRVNPTPHGLARRFAPVTMNEPNMLKYQSYWPYLLPITYGLVVMAIETASANTEPPPPTALVRRFEAGLFPPSETRESDFVGAIVQAMRLPENANAKVVGVGRNSGLIFVNASSNYREIGRAHV